MTMLHTWALQWQIPLAALQDLKRRMGEVNTDPEPTNAAEQSEAWLSNQVRLEASRRGGRLWRNNRGALLNPVGVPVRFGLANDTKQMDKVIKSSDLIGIVPTLVTPDMVGTTVGIFDSAEVKEPGWIFTGTVREAAQKRWNDLVVSLGGRARFISRLDQL